MNFAFVLHAAILALAIHTAPAMACSSHPKTMSHEEWTTSIQAETNKDGSIKAMSDNFFSSPSRPAPAAASSSGRPVETRQPASALAPRQAGASTGVSLSYGASESPAGATAAPSLSEGACCLVCRMGKACGDGCISRLESCGLPPGCACDPR